MTERERTKLEAELGRLTIARTKLQQAMNDNAQRCNEIATTLVKEEQCQSKK
jgi:hypothetical protein